MSFPVEGQNKTDVHVHAGQHREQFSLLLLFCSIQVLTGLDGVYSHLGGHSALLSLPIKVLISSGNIFTDRPRNNA